MNIFRKVLKELKLVSPAVVAVCALYVCIGLAGFFILGNRQDKIGGLTSNVLAGSIDTFIAVVLINYLISRNQRTQQASSRYAAYIKAEAALRILIITWREMVVASALQMPEAGEDLLSDKIIDHVANHLNLDEPAGIMKPSSWQSRACATGMLVQKSIEQITSRYAATLEPDVIVKCTAFENSGLVSSLANLLMASVPFQAKGITMQKPFLLTYAKESMQDVRDFVVLVHGMAKEFEGRKGFVEPIDFTAPSDSSTGRLYLSSAYVA